MPLYPDVPLVAYDAIRPSIQSGDLLLCSGTSEFARLIQHVTDSVWSHVGFIVRPAYLQRLILMESVESIGVRTVSLRSYVADYNGTGLPYPGRVYIARHAGMAAVADQIVVTALEGAIDVLGYPYDRQDIVRIAARMVAAKFGYRAAPVPTERAFICSEHTQRFFTMLGLAVPSDPRGFITPADFAACPQVTLLWELAS